MDRAKTFAARWLPFVPASSHRRIAAFLRARGYRIQKVLFWGRTYRIEKDGQRYLFKRTHDNGLICYRDVLPTIRQEFDRLAVPGFVDGGVDPRVGSWVIAEWFEGRTFNDRWDERDPKTAGGRAVPMKYVDVILDLLEDLARVDATPLVRLGIEERTRAFVLGRVGPQLEFALRRRFLSREEADRTLELVQPLLDHTALERLYLSNHDFYFRNFVELPDGRVALVDWDAARVSTFEIKHCVTYLWILMWNNPAWQRALLGGARQRLGVDPERTRAALLVKALNQSMWVWRDKPDLRSIVLETIKNVLDDSVFEAIWNGQR